MSDIKISLIGSAFRTNNWLKIYDSVKKNKIGFEIVYVGPNKPDFQLPDNFRFIQSDVKPVQCIEIAARAAKGELIQFTPDDAVFIAENSLELIYENYKKYNNYKNIFSMTYSENGKEFPLNNHRLDHEDSSTPIVGICNVISKSFFTELGGLDRSFIASMYDLDLSLRAFSSGGNVLMTNIRIDEKQIEMSEGSHTASEYWNLDRKHLFEIWKRKENKYFRNTKFNGFESKNLLKYSQGPRGRWRGNKPIIIEKFIDGPYKFLKIQFQRLFSVSKYLYYLKIILNIK